MGVARVVVPAPVALLAGGAVGVARVVAGHGVAPAPLALLAGGVVGVPRGVAPAPLAPYALAPSPPYLASGLLRMLFETRNANLASGTEVPMGG